MDRERIGRGKQARVTGSGREEEISPSSAAISLRQEINGKNG